MPPDHPPNDHAHAHAHSHSKTSKVEKRIDAAIAFTTSLLALFSAPGSTADILDTSLAGEIRTHIDQLHACQRQDMSGRRNHPEIDALGTRLWNLCTRLRRELLSSPPGSGDGRVGSVGEQKGKGVVVVRKVVLYGRVLALHLLVIAKPKEVGKVREAMRVLRLVLKAGMDCVEWLGEVRRGGVGGEQQKGVGMGMGNGEGEEDEMKKEGELATIVMEIGADYKGMLQDLIAAGGGGKAGAAAAVGETGFGEEEVAECNCLEVEYFILRTALAWIDKRLDVAEHMYTKAERLHKFLTVTSAEKLADVLYEIGKSLTARSDYALAVRWLDRANDIINTQSLEQLSREGTELRLAVLQVSVTALLGTDTPEGLEKAKNLVDFVENEVGSTRLIVSLLRLELLQKTPAEVFDDEAYTDVLRRMIRNFNSSDSGFKLIVHHIRKLHDKSPGAGCAVIDDFILALRNAGENVEWMESLIITRLWMITNGRDSVASIESVRSTISHISRPLSPHACVAAQGLIWKKIEITYSLGQFDLSEKWIQISLHSIFQHCGSVNKSKLERKLILCALARNNVDAAVSMIQNMPERNWNDEPMTAYLMFKVAVRAGNRELAERCLEAVSKTADHIDYLGACIAESQKAEDIYNAISGLKRLHDKYEHGVSNKIHLPALFRCAIRLLSYLLERPDAETKKGEIVEDLCYEFDAVITAVKQHDNPSEDNVQKVFSADELEWFSRNAYNLALKNTSTWDLRCVVRILTACVEIIRYFPADYSLQHMVDLSLKMLFSRFIVSSALVSLARLQDRVDQQQNDYREMRVHVSKFDECLMELLESERQSQDKGTLDQQSKEDMNRKLATLLVFDFEAAVALGKWDDLGGIVAKVKFADRNVHGEKGKGGNGALLFQAMADCLLRAAAAARGIPGQALYSTMLKIVNEIWVVEHFDAVKLAKYMRCLFQATLPLDDALGMNLLDESCRKAREWKKTNTKHWPDEELEWMATMSFNHAIDCYGAHEGDKAKAWASKAIELAHYCHDDGGLETSMRKKLASMKFERR